VTDIPEIIKSIVFNKGYSNSLITFILFGGQIAANSIEGHKAECKKAQKKPKNNIISEHINNQKPNLKPFFTTFV